MLLIHLMKIIWTGGEKISEIFAWICHDFSNLEDFSTSVLLILPLSYGNPFFVKFRKKLGSSNYLCTK